MTTEIVASEMVDLISVETLADELAATEPLTSVEFVPDGDSPKVKFSLPSGWNTGMKDSPGTAPTLAVVDVGGTEYSLTKDAILQATSLIGLQRDYVLRTPGALVSEHLNYWMTHIPNKSFKMLDVEGTGVAFTKGTVTPISNLALLEQAIEGLHQEYGQDTSILVDYKRFHDLRRTNFRLIVPEKVRTLKSHRSESDQWSLGIDVQNSLTAEAPTTVRGYLFAWWCTNGATSTHASSGSYSRKGSPTEAEALEWAKASVDDILGGLEHELDSVEQLIDIPIEGEVNATLHDIFTRYKVPAGAREDIISELVESDDLTMYGVMAAITQAANHSGLSAPLVARLLEVGGDLPGAATGRCGSCHRLPIT